MPEQDPTVVSILLGETGFRTRLSDVATLSESIPAGIFFYVDLAANAAGLDRAEALRHT